MDARDWDERYAGQDLLWGTGPNRWVERECSSLPPGRALDLACGEGRNAIWLAARGWRVTAVDFSQAALDRGARLLAEREPVTGSVEWVRADALKYVPEPVHDLVVIAYLQVPAEQRRQVARAAAGGLAPGGRLVVVAHDSTNIEQGAGGPQDPRVLYTAGDLVADLADAGPRLAVDVAEAVRRPVEGSERDAIDVLLVAHR